MAPPFTLVGGIYFLLKGGEDVFNVIVTETGYHRMEMGASATFCGEKLPTPGGVVEMQLSDFELKHSGIACPKCYPQFSEQE
jgi:hypothetical protein